MHKIDDLGQPIRGMIVRRQPLPSGVFGEDLRNLCYLEHEVDGAGHDRAARHAVILGLARLLRDDEPALRLDRLQPETAVAAGSREDHADRAFAEFVRQRAQEKVERQARAVTLARLRQAKGAGADREIGAGRDEIDMLGLERHAVRRLLDRQRRMAGQQIDHHACMRRIEMLDQNKSHSGAGREDREQPAKSIKASRRGAEPDNRETVSRDQQAPPSQRTPVSPRASRYSRRFSLFFHRVDRTTGRSRGTLAITGTISASGIRVLTLSMCLA